MHVYNKIIIKQYFCNKNNGIIYLEADSSVLQPQAELAFFAYVLGHGEALHLSAFLAIGMFWHFHPLNILEKVLKGGHTSYISSTICKNQSKAFLAPTES